MATIAATANATATTTPLRASPAALTLQEHLPLADGMCFGVELCMNSKAVNYFYTYFGVNPQTAGILGSCFGLMNIFAYVGPGLEKPNSRRGGCACAAVLARSPLL